MKIKLLVIGKTDDKNLNALIDMYMKRLKHYITFDIQVIPDIRGAKNFTAEQQKEREGELILNALENPDILVLLDENGQAFSSVEFSTVPAKENEFRYQTNGTGRGRALWLFKGGL